MRKRREMNSWNQKLKKATNQTILLSNQALVESTLKYLLIIDQQQKRSRFSSSADHEK